MTVDGDNQKACRLLLLTIIIADDATFYSYFLLLQEFSIASKDYSIRTITLT